MTNAITMRLKLLNSRYLPTVLSFIVLSSTIYHITLSNSLSDAQSNPQRSATIPMVGIIQSQNTTTTGSSKPPCRIFDSSETRSFIERESSSVRDPPKLVVETDERGILGRLRKIRVMVGACSLNPQQEEPRFRLVAEQIIDLLHPASLITVLKVNSTVVDDATKLAQWTEIQMLAYGNPNLTVPFNTKDTAACRNELLKMAYDIRAHYLLMADVNLFSVNTTSFISNFQWNETDWAVMTANIKSEYYYDLWSLRTLSENNFNEDIWSKVFNLCYVDKYCQDSVISKLIEIHKKPFPSNINLFEVRSAFGGAALYNLTATQGCQYEGGLQISDHVKFNDCVRQKNRGRIFINTLFTQ